VFAFAAVARSFPWEGARPVRLGVIVMCPWNLSRAVRAYAPDVLFVGWDARVWTRIVFRAWWSVFSLERCARRLHRPVVVGCAQRWDDLQWLSRQNIWGVIADVDSTTAACDKKMPLSRSSRRRICRLSAGSSIPRSRWLMRAPPVLQPAPEA